MTLTIDKVDGDIAMVCCPGVLAMWYVHVNYYSGIIAIDSTRTNHLIIAPEIEALFGIEDLTKWWLSFYILRSIVAFQVDVIRPQGARAGLLSFTGRSNDVNASSQRLRYDSGDS